MDNIWVERFKCRNFWDDCKCLLETFSSFLCKTNRPGMSWYIKRAPDLVKCKVLCVCTIGTTLLSCYALYVTGQCTSAEGFFKVMHVVTCMVCFPNNRLHHVCLQCTVPKVLSSLVAHEAANLEVIHLSAMLMFEIPTNPNQRIRCLQSCSIKTTLQCHLRLCIGTHHPYCGYNHQSGRQDFANGDQEVLSKLGVAKDF